MISPARRILLAAMLVTGGVVAFRAVRSKSVPDGNPVVRTTIPHDALLDSSLRALEDGVRETPRDRWDADYVVEQVGRSPDSLRRWVRDNTAWIPYRGTLRGPVGVLMDRQGNSLDRALLLADLLRRGGHSVRLARTEMPLNQASALLSQVVSTRPRPDVPPVASDPMPIAETAKRYGIDGTAIEQALDRYDTATDDLLHRVDMRVASQAGRLLSSVDAIDARAEWSERADSAMDMLRDHWWVQVKNGDSWSDFDFILPDSGHESLGPSEIVSPELVAPALHQRVTIRVVTERMAKSGLVETRVLEHAIRPRDVIGKAVVLQFWPRDWPALDAVSRQTAGSLRRIALEQNEWSAALQIGNDVVARATVQASAQSARSEGGVGGLGSAMANALSHQDGPNDGQLAAVMIEYLIDVPGRETRVIRRQVFDLLGPAARAVGVAAQTLALDETRRLTRSLALMMRTEILLLPAQPDAGFVAYLAARNLLVDAPLLRAVSQPGFGTDARKAEALFSAAEPGMGPLYALGVLRHEANGARAFLDQPVILTRHRQPRIENDSVGMVDATDIVTNEMGIALSASDGYLARLIQGIWDTNLEAMLGLAGGPAGNTGAAYESTQHWITLTPADLGRQHELQLPADAKSRIAADLRDGLTVVATTQPVRIEERDFTTWWRIRPQTGDALGIGENGWGQGAEYGSLAADIVVVGGRAFAFEYGLCQFIPQAANSLRVIGGEFWRLGLAPSWTQRTVGKDFEDVAVENHRVCVKQAILAGFLATAPLLIATARYRWLASARGSAAQVREIEQLAWREYAKGLRNARSSLGKPPAGLSRAQVRGGPIVPEAMGRPGGGGSTPIDPLGNTQVDPFRATDPGVRQTLPGPPPVRTLPGPPPVRTRPGVPPSPPATPHASPVTLEGARENLLRAKAARDASEESLINATREWIDYTRGQPGHRGELNPNWSKQVDADLLRKVELADAENVQRGRELSQARQALKKAQGSMPFGPPRPQAAPARPNAVGCPPNCAGNQNLTVPQADAGGAESSGAMEVGSAGAASSLSGSRKPPT